eukprot:TRINITY_DN6392_c0_g1_i6.p1 TRINITY_DN6392_c0_g1~~TRINITY_DN6392_c0_g1_i6.p1  ORF type:complete len:564 (-),score=62.42 TRINITY_DN6392_c0_g1_i6:108-1799(-)
MESADVKPEIPCNTETINENQKTRIQYSEKDNNVIEDIIENFEGGWILEELSKPNNGVNIREKRVWPKVAEEFNLRQNKEVTPEQLRRRYNCNKSIHKKKKISNDHDLGESLLPENVIDLVKSYLTETESVSPEFLSTPRSNLSNVRAEQFLAKSSIEIKSVWSALLLHVLRDLIQARYLMEDGILLLRGHGDSSSCATKVESSTVSEGETKEDILPEINSEQSNEKALKSDFVQDAIQKLLEGIKKYLYIEQFLEKSLLHESDVINCDFSSEMVVTELKTEVPELTSQDQKESLIETNEVLTSDIEVDFDEDLDFQVDYNDSENENNEEETLWEPDSQNLDEYLVNKENESATKSRRKIKRKRIKSNGDGESPKKRGRKKKVEADENGNFTCEHCGEIFQNKRKFSAHMRKHLNDYVIRCDLCNKGFEYKSQYELHLRKHTGERPYRCHICAAGFTQKNVLTDHLRTHTGEKPFKCSQCFLEFSQRSNLRSHMTIHSGEKPYKCDLCSKSFRLKDSWREHQSVHTGVKAFKCDQCPKEFRVKGKLRKHLRKQHNVTVFTKGQ